MKRGVQLLMLSGVVLAGCHTAEKVAVTSFRVVDTPARYIREKIDSSEQRGTTTTTTTTTSDVTNPGYAVTATPPPQQPPPRTRTTTGSRSPTSTARIEPTAPPRRTPANPSPRPAATQPAQFPTARQVPGKPGYVYSIDPNGGMIDVTGYKSGDKAKDPYTKQIFIVP